MPPEAVVTSIFLIFAGAAVFATLALFSRQSLIVSYIALGVALGPWGLAWVSETGVIRQISHVGVIFLLFLLGLNLHPQKLLHLLSKAIAVTLASSLFFGLVTFAVCRAFGFTAVESFIIGAASTFSSTIIGLKLLPTTQLHHQHAGEIIISILLLQDLIAIVLLLVLQAAGGQGGLMFADLAVLLMTLPAVLFGAILGARFVLVPLFARFDTIQEYVFLVAIGWCAGVSELATLGGLSQEIGAFLAGVALATHPISTFIAESLKPLRDFFLVLFFFSLGATFDLSVALPLLLPAGVLALVLLLAKPFVFRLLLQRIGESPRLSGEIGVRLGQVSEFALFIAVAAVGARLISDEAAYLLQLTTLLTFAVSSYWIVWRYPTPIAVSDRLRRD